MAQQNEKTEVQPTNGEPKTNEDEQTTTPNE